MNAKKNPFENLMTEDAPVQKAVLQPVPKTAIDPVQPVRRGPGRPPKVQKDETQSTTIRLDPQDHLAVRQLALRDGLTMNDLVFLALKKHCEARGVNLQGKAS